MEKTPQVWKAWFICSWSGYMTAASIMIHQPVKNWEHRRSPVRAGYKGRPGGAEGTSPLTSTPAATEAAAFLRSPQSTHSHSGQRKLSRKPAMCGRFPAGSNRWRFRSGPRPDVSSSSLQPQKSAMVTESLSAEQPHLHTRAGLHVFMERRVTQNETTRSG